MKTFFGWLPILIALLMVCPALAQVSASEDLQAQLEREEAAQKRAQHLAERARTELADLASQIQDHRLKPSGELLSIDPAQKSMGKITSEQMPAVEQGLYQARTQKDVGGRTAALVTTLHQQEQVVKQLEELLGQLSRSAATGASLHRAEKILHDQIKLNGDAKTALREAFGKAIADLPESLRLKIVGQGEEQLRIGREVVLLDSELEKVLATGPAKQQAGIKAARQIIADKHLPAMAQEVSDQLAANNASAATGGAELETQFKAMVAALQAATAGTTPEAPFDVVGPSLADLAAKDKELQELLDKLQKMIKEAQLAHHPLEKEEIRKLKNMQEELNTMLVEVNRDMPDTGNDELLEKLKQELKDAFAAMEASGEGLDKGDPDAAVAELKVSLSNLILADAELKALLATLAALQNKPGKPDDNQQETPAGIALGLGLRLGGNTTGASGPGGVLNQTKNSRQLGANDWGRLPPAAREQILQAIKEGFPADYADQIEQYYQNIAKSANNGK